MQRRTNVQYHERWEQSLDPNIKRKMDSKRRCTAFRSRKAAAPAIASQNKVTQFVKSIPGRNDTQYYQRLEQPLDSNNKKENGHQKRMNESWGCNTT